MKFQLKSLLIVLSLILLTVSCQNNNDIGRAVNTFMIFILQVISFVLFGVSALVLSIVSSSSKTNTPKTIGVILLSIFSLFSLINFFKVVDINPNENYIYYSFFVDVVVISISIYFLTKSKAPKYENEDVTDDFLDEIINSELEDEI